MEAKNSYFKKVARISNFKNVPYSVAKRHQHLVCAYLQGPFFSFDELQCGPCRFFYSQLYRSFYIDSENKFAYMLPGKLSTSQCLVEHHLRDAIICLLPDTSTEATVSQ